MKKKSFTFVLLYVVSMNAFAYIDFDVSLSSNINNGTVTTLPASPASSGASYEKGNTLVFYTPSTLTFNKSCLTSSGSETFTETLTGTSSKVLGDTFFDNGKITSLTMNTSGKRVTLVTSGGFIISNRCNSDQYFEMMRKVSLGENHWDYHIKGTVPAKITCDVNVPAVVDFGTIINKPEKGKELKKITNSITVTCSQAVDGSKYKVTTQVNGTSGIYNSTPTRLKISGDGGFITGSLSNNLTGSGICTADDGIKFDSTPITISSGIADGESISNSITWRLCSDGNPMSLGTLNASAIISVSIN